MKEKLHISPAVARIVFGIFLLALSLAVTIPSFAWFARKSVAAYAPVSANESLYIGAGHIEIIEREDHTHAFDQDVPFEDVRYLYLNGIDATDVEHEYQDFAFCVYGEAITLFRLQLGYTTNNQFSYEIYNANEAQIDSDGAVAYVTHGDTPATYYYKATGEAIPGRLLNVTGAATIANLDRHTDTYGEYSSSYVNQYAEPIYWQTNDAISGNSSGPFVKYFILRVYKEDKTVNDRETDVICIAAKSSSS